MLFISKKKGAFLKGIPLVLFFVFASLLFAQAAPPSVSGGEEPSASAGQDVLSQGQPRQLRETDESFILIDPPSSSSDESSSGTASARSYSSAGALLRLVVTLVLLCVACFFLIRFLRKSQRASIASDPFLKMTASLSLGQGKSVSVVTLGGRAFLLGVSDNSVSLIAEITDNELIDQMNLTGGMTSASKKNFAEMLSELLPKSRQKTGSSSTEVTANFIRERRASFKGGRENEQ